MAGYKLTDMKIKTLKAQPTLRRYGDGGGLFFVISPDGGRWWEFRFKFEGKEKSLGLGAYPTVTLARAREKHVEARREIDAGRDPVAVKKAAKLAAKAKGTTFESLAADYVKTLEQSGRGANYITAIEKRLKIHVLPPLGKRPIHAISHQELLEVFRAIRARANEIDSMDDTVTRCRHYCYQIFQIALREGLLTGVNPMDTLRGTPELKKSGRPVKHQRAVKSPAELGQLLADIDAVEGETIVGHALRLIPYVFVRPSEMAGGQWSEIDWKENLWRIPRERMKMKTDHLVPLAPQVKKRLEALHKLTGWGPSMFPGRSRGQATINAESIRRALNNLGYGPRALVNSTPHGFRSSAATLLRELGFDSAIVELQLAHIKRNRVQAAYDFAEYIPQRRLMMAGWANYLDRLRAEANGAAPEPSPEPQEVESNQRPALTLVR